MKKWRVVGEDRNSSRMWVYPPNCRTKVGARWSPSFPRQSLARRRARNIVQVHAHALNGSCECYHVVRIGLGAIWGDHGWRRSLHFTTPHFVRKRGGYTHFVHFPKIKEQVEKWHLAARPLAWAMPAEVVYMVWRCSLSTCCCCKTAVLWRVAFGKPSIR